MSTTLQLFADYRQLHLLDEESRGALGDAWTVQAVEDRIAAAPGAIGIGTREATTVRVTVFVLAAAPSPLPLGDHVTSASLQCSSGRVLVMGCTDELSKARRVAVPAGPLRVLAVHRLAGSETIELMLWPAPLAEPMVHVRFEPVAAKPRGKKAKPVSPLLEAARLARSGNTEAALPTLLQLSQAGDASAAGGAAELLAYQGRWAEAVEPCLTVIAKGDSFGPINPFVDHCRLLRVLARELADPSLIDRAAASAPAKFAATVLACLLTDSLHLEPLTDAQVAVNQAHLDKALADPSMAKRFKGKPLEFAAHRFAVAMAFRLDERMIEYWDEANPKLGFDAAVKAACALMAVGRLELAWQTIQARLAGWRPNHQGGCAPIELLVLPALAPMMNPARRLEVLSNPRAIDL
jgi:hypothetical protein